MADAQHQRSLYVTLLGLVANIVLAAVKMAAGLIGHSYALVADAVESFGDVASSIIVWRGLVVAAEPADADHPYGHGKAEPMAAAVVSSFLLLAAGGIIWQAMQKIQGPPTAPAPFTLIVLLAVVFIKEGLYRFTSRVARESGSAILEADAWHHRSDAITSLASAIGISVSLLGGPGFEKADAVAAILAALLIAWNAWRMLSPAVDELMDRAPAEDIRMQMTRVALEVSGVDEVEKCFVRKMGRHLYVDMHVEVSPSMTVVAAHEIAHQVKDRIREKMPVVRDVLVHIEPTGHRGK